MQTEQIIGVVHDASIGIRNKTPNGKITGYSGVCAAFNTEINVTIGQYVWLAIGSSRNFTSFEIHAININDDKTLDVECHEVGYWVYMLHRKENFDLRSIINSDVITINDDELIQKIREESSWC